ncbi:hypothetical protein [Nocardioides sp.]|uniref:hypothetical protein n=1 Tax=Nocardioides sp. TaxID=35761 RepID=UPI002622A94C|nr:hypothetical protein [Nocardioides sp.]MCW2736583.1 hypothetical protein [Nocardioides sp.]
MARHRTAVRIGTLALLAGALVPLGAAPAGASPGCLDEEQPTAPVLPGLPPIVTADGCDDDTPPDTTLSASSTPNAAGLVNVSTMTFSVAPVVSDADAGPFALECKLTGPAQAHDWRACTSPVTYTGLPDAAAGSYVFQARSVDTGDAALNPDSPLIPGTVADTPDLDQTPATLTWGQDTKAPFVFVTQSAYDEDTPTQPVITTPSAPLRLNSSEAGSSFECTDNGVAVPCTPGRWELDQPGAGRHVVTARTIDRAGNASAWSEPVEFFVPTNLARTRGWKKALNKGYFRGDALSAHRRGTRLVLPRTQVGELRLVAPSGPRLGKVRIRVGRRAWHVVDLAGPKSALRQYVVIDRYSGIRTGRIVIETLGNKTVIIDAVVARPNTFPAAQ